MKRKHTTRIGAYVLTGLGVCLVGGLAVAAVLNADEATDKRHCFVNRAPGQTLVLAFDVSDPLVAAEPRSIAFAIGRELIPLGKGDHVVAIDAAGKAPSEVVPIIDQCHPGGDDNIARNALKNRIEGPIENHLRDVQALPPAPQSPLVETILSVAADPSIHRPGSLLRILLVTDGLQNTAFTSVYRGSPVFPRTVGEPLRDITVELFIVKNERDLALQPRAIEHFKNWLTAAGAKVVYTQPAWLSLAGAAQGRGAR